MRTHRVRRNPRYIREYEYRVIKFDFTKDIGQELEIQQLLNEDWYIDGECVCSPFVLITLRRELMEDSNDE